MSSDGIESIIGLITNSNNPPPPEKIIVESINPPNIFPLNILFVVGIVLINAYLLRCLSRIFIQIFRGNGFNWGQVFELL